MFKTKNFTLIELLVVIAIISLLAAMLAPAIQKARGKASAIACLNNLYQINLLMVNYCSDNKDTYPHAEIAPPWGTLVDGRPAGWTYQLAWNAGSSAADSYKKLFRCPREVSYEFSYALNCHEVYKKNGGYGSWHSNDFSKAKMSPSNIIIVEESDKIQFTKNDCDQDNYTQTTTSSDIQLHGNISLLFVDGHAGHMRFFDDSQMTYYTNIMSGWSE